MPAYEVLADEHVLPSLHSSSDSSRTLVVEYLDDGVDLTATDAFEELIHTVAVVHTASGRWHPAVAEAMSSWQVETALSTSASDWISRPADWQHLMRLMADAYGPDHLPLGYLDNELGAQWTDVEPVNALTAFATATGLHSLHGVQS
jgi:hypothetical protein